MFSSSSSAAAAARVGISSCLVVSLFSDQMPFKPGEEISHAVLQCASVCCLFVCFSICDVEKTLFSPPVSMLTVRSHLLVKCEVHLLLASISVLGF